MATHVIEKDGEKIYLNDAEWKAYKAAEARKKAVALKWTIIILLILGAAEYCYKKYVQVSSENERKAVATEIVD